MSRLVPKQLSEAANAEYLGVPGEIITIPGVGMAIHNGAVKGGNILRFPVTNAGKNILRNSRFMVKQNGNLWMDIPSSGDSHYIADGWFFQRGGGSKANCAISNTYRNGEDDVIDALRTTTISGGGSSSFSILSQRFADVRLLSGRTCTLSFKAKCNVARRIALEFGQTMDSADPNKNLAIGQAELTSSWQKFEFTFQAPELPDPYSLGGNNHNYLYFWLEAGDAFNSRTGGITPFSGSTDITNVQLEIGDKATDLEFLTYYEELAKVQEYYETYSGVIGLQKEGFKGTASPDVVGGFISFAQRKKFTPTVTTTTDFLTADFLYGVSSHGFNVQATANSAVSPARLLTYKADAEIQP